MPRIRKKTSNRGSTNERKKILHKVRESRKKKVKAAKKNPQWKSKTKKDPGIPNNFPYKDQILAEIADQRRVAAEEKQRRKEQKKTKKTANDSDAEDEEMEDAGSGDDNADEVFAEVKALGLAQGFDGIASLSAKRLDNTKLKPREVPMEVEEEPEEEVVPVLINPELPNLQAVLNEADVVVQVLDARDPLPFRSAHLEELAGARPGQRVLLVLNKIDTCPRESVASWTTYLRAQHPTLPFTVASAFLPAGPELIKPKGKGKAKVSAENATGVDSVLECLGEWANQKKGDMPLCVAVVGFTNVGKTSFVNSLLRKYALPIYTLATSSRGPTTTTYAQEVTIEAKGKSIRVIDTPGISWASDAPASEDDAEDAENIENIRARDILMRSKGRIDRLKDPMAAVKHIVARSNTEDLMLLYSLPAFSAGDTDSFLSCVARAHQLVKKKGELDLTGAARIVLRDWSVGKFPRYTLPPAGSASSTALSTADEAVLATLQPRKEMRKARGLVKFTCGVAETRKATVDEPWALVSPAKDAEDDDEGEDEDEDVQDEDVEMEAEVDDEGSDDAEEELEPPPIALSGKQKRKRAADKAPLPRKKVSFGPDPKTSKQARSVGSLVQKPTAAAKEKPLKPAAPKKVANAAVKKKPAQKVTTAGASTPGQEYNFGEFF